MRVSRHNVQKLMGGASVAVMAVAAQGAHAQVVADSTHTTVTAVTGGNEVTTNNINASGKTAFNRFSQFNVQAATTTTLILPTGTNNLVNVVAGNVQVDGAVVSRLQAQSGVGGNLFFVTSGGFVVGAGGSINTGRLIVRGGTVNTDALVGSTAAYDPASLVTAASSITVNGTINAPGGIDLNGTTVSIGGAARLSTGAAGLTGVAASATGASVNTAALVQGTALVKVNGGIAIVGDDSVTVAAGAVLDAAPSAAPTSLPGGIDVRSTGSIALGGTLRAWDGTSATAGDITVATVQDVALGGAGLGVGSLVLDPYISRSTAATGVAVTGTLTGGTVSITASSKVATDEDFDVAQTTLDEVRKYIVGKFFEQVGLGVDAFYAHAVANSAISVGAGASVTARGALTIAAASTLDTSGDAEAERDGDGNGAALALGIAQLAASAKVTIDGALRAGGAVNLSATNDVANDLRVVAISKEGAKAGSLAYVEATVAADVLVNAGASIGGSSVTLTALNAQADANKGFDTRANVFSVDGSAGGGTAAVTNLNLAANVAVAGAIGTTAAPVTGAVTVLAETRTNHVNNAAAASTGGQLGLAAYKLKVLKAGGEEEIYKGLLGQFAAAADMLMDGKEEAASGGDSGSATRFGAAVGVLLNDQRANVALSGSVIAGGAVTVDSRVRDLSVRNLVKASVAATKSKDGAATSVAGAAAWADHSYTSHATVGGTVTSAGLAVNALTDRPRGGSYDIPFTGEEGASSDVTSFISDLLPKLSPDLGLTAGFFGNAAGASAKTESAQNAAVSGSISYASIAADTRAWINPGAALTLGGTLAVKAATDIVLMNLGGALPTVSGGLFGTAGGNAGGAAVAVSQFDPTTVAGIGKGVTLTRAANAPSVNVDVDAVADIQSIVLAPVAGKGNAVTGSGTFATNVVTGTTHATISKDARLDLGLGAFTLNALSDLELWTVGGSVAVTKADGTGSSSTAVSVGVAGALNDVTMDTRARVIDATGTDASTTGVVAAATPGITAGSVAIGADTRGSLNAISVAGVLTNSTPATPKADADGGTDSAKDKKGTFARAKDKLTAAAGLINAPIVKSLADYADSANKAAESAPGGGGGTDKASGKPVTKGFGVAGSASVNLSDLTTRVETTGANFIRATGATGAFSARAVEAVDMLSVTGGAAISTGKSLSGGNNLLAGAYGLSYSNNATATALGTTTVTGFGAVNVEAAANGSRIAAGLSIAADLTTTTNSKAVAGSVSHLIARDGVSATVTDGALTGSSNGAVGITAYNGLVMGAGAGGLSWGRGQAFGGAATVIDIAGPAGSDAATARLVRTTVAQFTDVSVRALTAARIASIAAAGAVNVAGDSNKYALTAALAVNLVSMDASALIDTGATGTGTLNVSGAVNVFAGDRDNSVAEALAGTGRSSTTAGASFLDDYQLSTSDFSSDDPVQTADLKGGTQVLSIAVPVSASRGKAIGVGFAWNGIDNDRTASIIGGAATPGAATITAGRVSVQAIERSDILALGVGIGASTEGSGVMGSASRNLIEGSSSAGIGRSAGAANNLGLTITGAPSATPNVSVGASGEGGIFSLAGAVGVGQKASGGLAIAVNQIQRTTAADTGGIDQPSAKAGLRATIDGVSLAGTPDVLVLANAKGRIVGNAVAIAGSTNGVAAAGAASVNEIAPTIAASAAHLSYAAASSGDLVIRATDSSSILSTAIVAGISSSNGGVAAGVSVNRIDAAVGASLRVAAGEAIAVRTLLVESSSTAGTKAFGLGAGGGSKFGGAGSIVVNLTDSDTTSLVDVAGGGTVNTTGSVGVVARRDTTMDVLAGALAVGAQGAAIGASVVVNNLGGSTDAQITGAGTVNAWTGTGAADGDARALTGLRTGALTSALPQFDALDGFKNLALGSMVQSAVGSYRGVAVNASSTAAVRTLAITGSISGSGVAVGVTGVVDNVTSSTNAAITGTTVYAGTTAGTQTGVAVDVRASSQQVGLTFAGAVAGSGGGVAAAAPVISDGYAGTTRATIDGGAIRSTGAVNVKAIANQSSTTLAASGAVGSSVGAAVAGVSPRFQSVTEATIKNVTALVASGSDGVAVNANSSAKTLATFVTLAIGGSGAGAAAVVVATNENQTRATYSGLRGADGLGSVTVAAPSVSIIADGVFDATVAGASAAASATFSIVGNGVGIVHRGVVAATGDALRYGAPTDAQGNRATAATGAVTVKATESVTIAPSIGQVAIGASPVSGGVSLGVIAILSQSKVDAMLSRPTIAARTVDVSATGYNQINAAELGVAIGGIGIGANVSYIAIGKVSDAGALTTSSNGNTTDSQVASSTGSNGGSNSNMTQLQAGGSRDSGQIAGQTGSMTSTGERSSAAGSSGARGAFTENAQTTAGDTSQSRVQAQITGGTGTGTAMVFGQTGVTIDSDANLLSKSTNVQATGGLAAGSATVGITRNASESIAQLGAVDAWGGALSVTATTGEAKDANARTLINAPTMASENVLYAGTVGIGALSVGFADARLESLAKAESNGRASFVNTTVRADDTTRVSTTAVGAVAGGAALNVVVSRATKSGTVLAGISNNAVTSGTLQVLADGGGGATAKAYAGSGGAIFAGNAAVAEATDRRTITAQIAENSIVRGLGGITIKATNIPLVDATSIGVAVSGGVAAGASVALATSTGTLSALVGEGGSATGTLNVTAETTKPGSGNNVHANAIGSAGGLLAALNGSVAIASTTLATNAVVGADLNGSVGSALRQIGTLNVKANREIAQYSESTGVTAAGVLAVGVQRAEANSDGRTRAALENVDGSLRYTDMIATLNVGGEMQVVAERFYDPATIASSVLDHNTARVTAGAGGLGAGIAADAVTHSNGSALTEIFTPTLPGAASASDTNKFFAGALTVTSKAAADYHAESDSVLATLAGGSGTTSSNYVGANATTNVGRAPAAGSPDKGSYVTGTVITVRSDAQIAEGNGGSATGAGGGVVTGQAASVVNRIDQTATVNLGNGLTLRQYGGDVSQNSTAIFIDAAVTQAHSHSAALDVGGVMSLPFALIDGEYRGATRVNIGRNVLIRGDQGIGIGTATQQNFADTVAVQIYGLAGLGGGKADSSTYADGQIAIGNGTIIESLGDVSITAGSAANGQGGDVYHLVTQTDTFNNTILPLDSEASAYSNVHGANRLIIGDAAGAPAAVARFAFQGEVADANGKTTATLIRSARDVVVESRTGASTPSAEGTGHNPYLKLFSLTTHSGSTTTDVSNAMVLNGANLVAGFLNDRQLTIDSTTGVSTRDGVAIGGNGFTYTSNDALYHAPGDTDWLGRYAVSQSSYNAYATIKDQITAKKAEAQRIGIAIPIDPAEYNNFAINTEHLSQQELRNRLNAAAVKSDIIAQLSSMYETKAALLKTATEAHQLDANGQPMGHSAVVIGGALTASSKLSLSGTFVDNGADGLGQYQIYTDRIGALFAAGGRVSLGADKITGSGRVTALGAPTINITNNTSADTVLGNFYIPFKVNGAIEYLGTARTLPGSIQAFANTADVDPSINVSTGRARSDIVTLGAIANIAGAFRASTLAGNYVQFGTVNVKSFSAYVPNGLFTVSTPEASFSQGLPLAYWYGQTGTLSLYDVTGRPGLAPEDAIEALASYIATVRLGIQGLSGKAQFPIDVNVFGLSGPPYATISSSSQEALLFSTYASLFGASENANILRSLFLDDNSHRSNAQGGAGTVHQGSDGSDSTSPAGVTLFGSCRIQTCEFYSPDGTMGSNNQAADHIGDVRVFNGNSDSIFDNDTIHTVIPLYHDTVILRNSTTVADKSTLPTIRATQVIINALNVDISGVIEAGPVKDRKLTILNTVGYGGGSADIGQALAQGSSAQIDLVGGVSGYGSLLSADSRNLGAQFVRTGVVNGRATGYIQVDDVVAGGGGSISITGKILNTSPVGGGMLKVLNGYGTVSIDNQTGYELRVGTVNAGLSADGIIKLSDTWSHTIYEYTNSLDGQVKLNVTDLVNASNGGAYTPGFPTDGFNARTYEVGIGYNAGLVGGARLDYTPSGDGQFYYLWNDSESLARTISDTGANNRHVGDEVTTYTVSPWAKTGAGAAPDGTNGRFVNLQESRVVTNSIPIFGKDRYGDDCIGSPCSFFDQPAGYNYQVTGQYTFTTVEAVDPDSAKILRALGGRKDDFVQVLTGNFATNTVRNYYYNDSDDGDDGAFIEVPLNANITIASAARATHPIQILFDQGKGANGVGGGAINITSNNGGQITLTGAVTFGGGKTTISTNSSIVSDKDGIVVSRDISLNAGSSIGTIGTTANPLLENPFQASLMGGAISAYSRTGQINLRLSSAATEGDHSAPIYIDQVRAAGDVKLTTDVSLIGNDTNAGMFVNDHGNVTFNYTGNGHVISDNGSVTLDVTGTVAGRGYAAGSLTTPALRIGVRDDRLVTITATGDVAIEQGRENGAVAFLGATAPSIDTGTGRTLRIGDITTPGDVTIRAYGSIVAGDPTATVDEEKLSRFRAAAKALQLDSSCAGACGIIDPAQLGLLDQQYREAGYALIDQLNTGTPAQQNAAQAQLISMFGFTPTSKEAIATVAIDRAKLQAYEAAHPLARTDKIEFQLRNQAEAAYDRYALTNAAGTAEESRGRAVTATLATFDQIAAFGAKTQTGISLSGDGRTVTIADPTATSLAAGDSLYTLAVTTLAKNGKAPELGARASATEINEGLQLYVNGLAAPAKTFGTQLTAVSGISFGTDGRTVQVSAAAAASLAPGSALYDSALAALTAAGSAPAGGAPLTAAQLRQGLQLKYDALAAPVTSFAATLTNGIAVGGDFTVTVPGTAADQLNGGGSLYQLALTTLAAGNQPPAAGATLTAMQIQQGLQAYLDTATAVDLFRAKFAPGITLSADGRSVSVTNAAAFALTPGGDLYTIAINALAQHGETVTGNATATQLQNGLQYYLNDLRAPVADLLPTTFADVTKLTGAAKTAAVTQAITGAALTDWVAAQNLMTQRSRATADALGRVEQIRDFGAGVAGFAVAADGKSLSISAAAWNDVSLKPGGALYELGLTTLRAQVSPSGLRETVPLPTNSDIQNGLQKYLTSLRTPLLDLFPTLLPTVLATASSADKLAAVSQAITAPNLMTWAATQQASAVTELTGLFGNVAFSRSMLQTGTLINLNQRTSGSTWTATMLNVAVPSTAFVPVADTQIETRRAAITAHGVTLIAGNSIGAFDKQLTFTYNAAGFAGARDATGAVFQYFGRDANGNATDITKDLAEAYLAASGPGDIRTDISFVNPGAAAKDLQASEIRVTTRRDQPLQINAGGTVNAISAVNFTTFNPTATGVGSTVLGDIFISNDNALTVGSIISEKPTVSSITPVAGCNTGAASPWLCDSRIRLVAADVIGTTAGVPGLTLAAAVTGRYGATSTLLSNADGSAVVMGGLVRIESSNGSVRNADGSSLKIDARAVEVLRAAADASIERRQAVAIPTAIGAYSTGNDLRIGDVFAGERLQIDNRYGSLFVIGIPSILESETRNSRIVANRLALRAAGDIGAAGVTAAGLPAQFDIQAPIITQLVAGFDYATGLPGLLNQQPAGLPAGDGFFAIRGIVQIGSPTLPGTMLGARRNMTVGTLNNDKDSATPIKSSIIFASDILVGNRLFLTTDGDVSFPYESTRITGLGSLTNPYYDPAKVIDLSALELNIKGAFNFVRETRSIILGSLTAGGGTVESKTGFVHVDGTLYGNGGPDSPFTIKAKTEVTVGSTGLGAITLLACSGILDANCASDVTVTGQARASDFTAVGRNISIASGLYGRSATLTAAQNGTVTLSGAVLLQRDSDPARASIRSEFNLSGGSLSLSGLVSAQDKVSVHGQTIVGTARTTFLNTDVLDLAAIGALRLDPSTTFVDIGAATLSSGSAAAGGSAVTIGSFSGGSLRIDAPVGIAIGSTTLSKGLTLNTLGAAAINGTVAATGAVSANARSISFGAASQGVIDSSVLNLTVAEMIATTASTNLRSRGLLTVSARDSLSVAAVRGAGGSITISGGDLAINNGLISDGADFRIGASGAVRFQAATTLAGSLGITAGSDILFNGATAMNGLGRNATLSLNAGGALTLGRLASITAISTSANVQIAAASVTMDPLTTITGASVSINATGGVTAGDIKANQTAGQLVSLRASGALSVGQITAGTTLVTAAGGMAVLRGPVSTGDLTVTARDDISTNGIIATSATLNSSTGAIGLGGTTRVRGTAVGAPGATLSVTAAKSITLGGPVSAASGMMLMGKVIATTAAGYISDADGLGAVTTLRADTINVGFDTGQTTGTALRIDARGYSSANVDDATFRFTTLRPIQFDTLFVNKGTIAATTALTYVNRQVRDYLTTSAGTSGPSGGGSTGGGTTPTPTPTPTPEPTPTPTPTSSSRARAR